LGLVGESGCGKSSLARAIVGLLPVARGFVRIGGNELTALRGGDFRRARRAIQLVFQDPYGSLNPRLTAGNCLAEAVAVGRSLTARERSDSVVALLAEVGLAPEIIHSYPHELSGGQRQRVAIARALAVDPLVLVADEPTSALDVPVQARILNLLGEIQQRRGMAILMISHDLHLVNKVCQRVAVMYLGRIVEQFPIRQDVQPLHPYPVALAAATPSLRKGLAGEQTTVPVGEVPSLVNPPPGCPFEPRCVVRKPACKQALPPLQEVGAGRQVRCPVVLQAGD
jgi:oligopeptide/dipeptide ABC transporter ATP-binding protein